MLIYIGNKKKVLYKKDIKIVEDIHHTKED